MIKTKNILIEKAWGISNPSQKLALSDFARERAEFIARTVQLDEELQVAELRREVRDTIERAIEPLELFAHRPHDGVELLHGAIRELEVTVLIRRRNQLL